MYRGSASPRRYASIERCRCRARSLSRSPTPASSILLRRISASAGGEISSATALERAGVAWPVGLDHHDTGGSGGGCVALARVPADRTQGSGLRGLVKGG